MASPSETSDHSELLKKTPHVTAKFVAEVQQLPRSELERRVLVQKDWLGHYSRCIDGLGIKGIGVESAWNPREIRRAFEKQEAHLARYKQALTRANGFLIMNHLEPVKLEYSSEEPARELSPSEAASFDKTLARSPRVKSPGVRAETIDHGDGTVTEMHMLGDLLKEPEKSSGEQLYRLRPLCICDNALTNQNPACPIHGSSEKASEPPKLNKYTGFDRPGADCEHCKRQLRDHGPNYECPPLNGKALR